MKSPLVTGTETVGFSGEGARQRQLSEFRRLRAEGVKHVVRFTDQKEGAIVYCVSWPRTAADIMAETVAEAEQVLAEKSTLVPLTEDLASDSMVNEGGNPAEEKK